MFLSFIQDTYINVNITDSIWKHSEYEIIITNVTLYPILIYFLKKKIINAVSLIQVLTKYTV